MNIKISKIHKYLQILKLPTNISFIVLNILIKDILFQNYYYY